MYQIFHIELMMNRHKKSYTITIMPKQMFLAWSDILKSTNKYYPIAYAANYVKNKLGYEIIKRGYANA